MSWVGYVVITVVAVIVLFQLSIYLQAKRLEGKQAPSLGEGDRAHGSGRSLIYFHSPSCGPCRRMTPVIEALAGDRPGRVTSVDISQDMASAQRYNVRATPTIVLVEDGTVAKVLLGPQSEKKLGALLA